MARGLILFSCFGSLNGVAGDMMLFTPPLIVTREQVDEIIDIAKETLDVVKKAALEPR